MSKKPFIILASLAAASFILVNCSGEHFFIPNGKIILNRFLPDFFLTLFILELFIGYYQKKHHSKKEKLWIPILKALTLLAIVVLFGFLGKPALIGCIAALVIGGFLAILPRLRP
jgi:peptidoglycan/LPS O-acetylase OafA/YrhL